MDYEEALNKVRDLLRFGVKPGLDRIKKLLQLLDNPQDKLRFVHVAGTNGKGSVCTMISNVLQQAGYKVGLFTSPYIVDFRERFQINSEMISTKELTEIIEYVYNKLEKLAQEGCIITEFEFITAVAFEWFRRSKCDVVVLEVGLGGRFDATNVIKSPLVSVITSISYDHTAILGDTLDKIAFEKAGIIKDKSPVVLYPQDNKEVTRVISDKAKKENSPLILAENISFKEITGEEFKHYIEIEDKHFPIPFFGAYQVKNTLTALLAIGVLKNSFNISYEDTVEGLRRAKIPARLEVLQRKPLILLDGAHNYDAFVRLAEFIKEYLYDKRVYMVLGILRDKAVSKMVNEISRLCDRIFTVTPKNDRALSSEELCKIVKEYNKNVSACESIEEALKQSQSLLDENSCLVICGSLYLAGEVKNILKEEGSN